MVHNRLSWFAACTKHLLSLWTATTVTKKNPLSTNIFIYGRGDTRLYKLLIHLRYFQQYKYTVRDLCILMITKFQENKRTRQGFTIQIHYIYCHTISDNSKTKTTKMKRQRFSAIQTKWHNENLSLYYPHWKKYCATIYSSPFICVTSPCSSE